MGTRGGAAIEAAHGRARTRRVALGRLRGVKAMMARGAMVCVCVTAEGLLRVHAEATGLRGISASFGQSPTENFRCVQRDPNPVMMMMVMMMN